MNTYSHTEKKTENQEEAYSLKFLEMAFRSDRMGILPHADAMGEKTGECGDSMTFYINVRDGLITRINCVIDGCMMTTACANMLISMVEGRTVADAWEITPEFIRDALETLPPDHFHCAELAVGALYMTLADYQSARKNAWKSAYRTSPAGDSR